MGVGLESVADRATQPAVATNDPQRGAKSHPRWSRSPLRRSYRQPANSSGGPWRGRVAVTLESIFRDQHSRGSTSRCWPDSVGVIHYHEEAVGASWAE